MIFTIDVLQLRFLLGSSVCSLFNEMYPYNKRRRSTTYVFNHNILILWIINRLSPDRIIFLDHLQVRVCWMEWQISLTFSMCFYWDPKANSYRFVEGYLGPCQTSMIKFLYNDSYQDLVINYFPQNFCLRCLTGT